MPTPRETILTALADLLRTVPHMCRCCAERFRPSAFPPLV